MIRSTRQQALLTACGWIVAGVPQPLLPGNGGNPLFCLVYPSRRCSVPSIVICLATMREKQRYAFNKRAGGFLIAGAFILLGVIVVVSFHSPSTETFIIKETPSPPSHLGDQLRTPSRVRLQSSILPPLQSDFYRTIIDNNLFRPLGWTHPPRQESYRLLGTILSTDADTPLQAILQTTIGNTTHTVTIGEKLDTDTEVVDIQPKRVILSTKGQQRTLKLNSALWLNTSRANRLPIGKLPPAPTARETTDPHRRIGLSKWRTPASTTAPAKETPVLHQYTPLSEWQTSEGQLIRIGDARLKNPEKWGLHRR